MGGLYTESALRQNNLQNTYEKSLGMTDGQYTAAVDNDSYDSFVRDSAGYSLAQWTFWSRKEALLNYAHATGKSIGDLDIQLDFLTTEIAGYKAVIEKLLRLWSTAATALHNTLHIPRLFIEMFAVYVERVSRKRYNIISVRQTGICWV